MKIKQEDLERWRSNTLKVAQALSFPETIVRMLKRVELKVIPEDSGRRFYGLADCWNHKIFVYQSNPSKYLPTNLREIWNQSGMDHELVGHLGSYLMRKPCEEQDACTIQRRFIVERSKESGLWRVAKIVEPAVTGFRLIKNRKLYA